MLRRLIARDAGFMLAEVVGAAAIVTLTLTGVLVATTAGISGLDGARRSTTAVLLAEQRMEQIKEFALSTATSRGWANVTTANFAAEPYGAIASYADYRRSVTVTDSPGGAANTKQIEVWAFYRGSGPRGLAGETGVVVSTLLAQR